MAQTLGILALVLYFAVKDVIAPLVRQMMKRKVDPGHSQHPLSNQQRINVLELDLVGVKAQVVDLRDLLAQGNEATTALDQKMDVILQDFQEMRSEVAEFHRLMAERITRAETHIEHLLRRTGRAGD